MTQADKVSDGSVAYYSLTCISILHAVSHNMDTNCVVKCQKTILICRPITDLTQFENKSSVFCRAAL